MLDRLVFDDLFENDHPIAHKLRTYTLAHLNYLESLHYLDIVDHKINWGLLKTRKLDNK